MFDSDNVYVRVCSQCGKVVETMTNEVNDATFINTVQAWIEKGDRVDVREKQAAANAETCNCTEAVTFSE